MRSHPWIIWLLAAPGLVFALLIAIGVLLHFLENSKIRRSEFAILAQGVPFPPLNDADRNLLIGLRAKLADLDLREEHRESFSRYVDQIDKVLASGERVEVLRLKGMRKALVRMVLLGKSRAQ